jgi:histidyl-tRNA synthetase
MLEVDNVKGFEDYIFPESIKREKISEIAKKYFKIYGFIPVETPIIEYDELMKPDTLPSEQDDEAISERFKLRDRAGRNLGLRYEFTFQLSKLMKKNPNLKMPLRFYQIGQNFRDEPIRTGRTRQFTQLDADVIGDINAKTESELLEMTSNIFSELKIDHEIQINNRKLLEAIIESVQIPNKKQVMRELDKINKIGEDLVKLNLKKYADANQVITLFKLLEKSIEFFIENAFEGSEEVSSLLKECKKRNIDVKFNPFMIRGFSYYTGNIFEVSYKGSTIAGGGRYDRTIGKYIGKEIPAVGISFSLEALLGICSDSLEKMKFDMDPKALIISIEKDSESYRLLKTLRKSEISSIMLSEKPGKALEYANFYSIPFVIFIGNDEIKNNKFKLRDMNSGEENLFTEKQLISFIKNPKKEQA